MDGDCEPRHQGRALIVQDLTSLQGDRGVRTWSLTRSGLADERVQGQGLDRRICGGLADHAASHAEGDAGRTCQGRSGASRGEDPPSSRIRAERSVRRHHAFQPASADERMRSRARARRVSTYFANQFQGAAHDGVPCRQRSARAREAAGAAAFRAWRSTATAATAGDARSTASCGPRTSRVYLCAMRGTPRHRPPPELGPTSACRARRRVPLPGTGSRSMSTPVSASSYADS